MTAQGNPLATCPQLAFAEDNQPFAKPAKQGRTTEFGPLKNCALVTHNCELCSVGQGGHLSCSNAGIACVPTEWRCLVPQK